MLSRVVPEPHERPEVEVLTDDGHWHYGLLRMWTQLDDNSWLAQVGWSAADGNRIDTFPADRVRPLEQGEPRYPRQ